MATLPGDEDAFDGPEDDLDVEEQHEDTADDANDDDAGEQSGDDIDDEHSPEPVSAVEERPRSRAQERVERALREAKAAREEAEAARRELAQAQTARNTQAEAEREAATLANMEPWERAEYRANQIAKQTEARIGQLQFQMADSADRTDFASKCARMPALAAVADDVEKNLAEMRRSGTTAPRETIAKYLLGERALARAAGNKTRATKAGAARIASNAGRPTGARSDVAREPARGDTASARAKRLEGLNI